MANADHCKRACEQFIRMCLPKAAQVARDLCTVRGFKAVPDRKPGTTRFETTLLPNWWQVARRIGIDFGSSQPAGAAVRLIGSVDPFRSCIGKSIGIPSLGVGIAYPSAEEILRDVLVSYLCAADRTRWSPAVFEETWSDCQEYFDETTVELAYKLYAPVYGSGGVGRHLTLDSTCSIERVRPQEVARLASWNRAFVGSQLPHALTQWTTCFYVRPLKLQKEIREIDSHPTGLWFQMQPWRSDINTEVAFLRSLVAPQIAIPSFGVVRDGVPPYRSERPQDLPWRPAPVIGRDPISKSTWKRYVRQRKRLLDMEGETGWTDVAASMRRFAVAWENPFPADALADIVAALERLLVRRETGEVSYKVRIRASHMLGTSSLERQRILEDLRDAYNYRSRVAHGDFVFDDAKDWDLAKRVKRAKGKGGNPFHDVNEIHRLKYVCARYFRQILARLLRRRTLDFDWHSRGL